MIEAERTENEDVVLYCYEPLPERATRLLQIPEKSIDQPWSLEAYDLENCPSYVCLSYTWGPPLDTQKCKAIYEGAKRPLNLRTGNRTGRLNIELNLWESLEQLIASGYTGHLWADAICINQKDVQERSSQVAHMGRIYADSQEVIVWLGKDESNLEHFSWFHTTLLPALDAQFVEGGVTSHFLSIVEAANLGVDPTARWRGYVLFYEQRRWFHRCWVIQEVAVAKKVSVFCGSKTLDFEEICDLAMFLHDVVADVLPGDWQLEIPHTELLMGHKGFAIAAQRAVCGSPELPRMEWLALILGAKTDLEFCYGLFLSALSAIRGYQASDPRDKVYAALGMATKFLPPGETIMVPDYSLSISEVYRKAAIFLVEHLPYLSVLSYVADRTERVLSDLPSWVPDFSPKLVGAAYATRYEIYPHNACPSHLLGSYPRSVAGSTLQVYGGIFDAVTMVVDGTDDFRNCADQSVTINELRTIELCHRLVKFCSCLDRRYVKGESRLEALSRTLILNQVDRRPVSGAASPLFRDWLLNQLALASVILPYFCEMLVPFQACCKSLGNLEEAHDGTLPSEDSILTYSRLTFTNEITIIEARPSDYDESDDVPPTSPASDVDDVRTNSRSYGRALNKGLFLRQRLYKTSSGCIGLGPPSMRPGDQVYFVCDATVPFVLRPQRTPAHYILIGETYLHGFMNGEVLNNNFKDRIEPLYLV